MVLHGGAILVGGKLHRFQDDKTAWLQAQQAAEQERQQLLALQAAEQAISQSAQEADMLLPGTAGGPGDTSAMLLVQQSMALQHSDEAPAAPGTAAAPVEGNDASSGRKRRRTAVDYIALNKQMEAEASRPAASPSFTTAIPSTAVGVHAGAALPNERPDTLMDDTALVAEQAVTSLQQPREGDKTV